MYDWQKKYREGGGLAELSTKMAPGRKKLLTDRQLLQLSGWLRMNPRQLGFDFGLWTRKIVRELIRREFGIDYTPQNVGKILKMLGFSPQRPVWQALERDPEKRRKWTEETFPAIKKRADREGAKIYFADEAYSRTDHHAGTTWAPVGQTPVAEHIGARGNRHGTSVPAAPGGDGSSTARSAPRSGNLPSSSPSGWTTTTSGRSAASPRTRPGWSSSSRPHASPGTGTSSWMRRRT